MNINKMLGDSENITNPNKILSEFLNNTSMARILDIFLDNPTTAICTLDLLRVGDLSRKSLETNIPVLIEKGMLSKETVGKYRFFTWNPMTIQAKHLAKLRDILNIENGKQLPSKTTSSITTNTTKKDRSIHPKF